MGKLPQFVLLNLKVESKVVLLSKSSLRPLKQLMQASLDGYYAETNSGCIKPMPRNHLYCYKSVTGILPPVAV